MSDIVCEGRCGTHLTRDGHERSAVRTPRVDDVLTRHTVNRCKAMRRLREALEAARPDAFVDMHGDYVGLPSGARSTLAVHVEVRYDGQAVHLVRRLADHLIIDCCPEWLPERFAAEVVAELDKAVATS